MDRFRVFAVSVVFFLFLSPGNSETEEVKQALIQFMAKLSPGNVPVEANWGWNLSSDPCNDKWEGVECDGSARSVRKIVLNKLNLSGNLDAASLCVARSLFHLSLEDNNISGDLPEKISNCKRLRHLYLHGNNFWGKVPRSISKLNNLKRFDISHNEFSGQLPDMSRISGLLTFTAQFNQLTGKIPNFYFSNLQHFNVSYNNLSGPIPDVSGHFDASSFQGNPGLCGKPLSNTCPPPPPAPEKDSSSVKRYLIYSGYAILALAIVFLVALKLIKVNKDKKKKRAAVQAAQADKMTSKTSGTSSDSKAGGNRSEYSITSVQSGMASPAFVILSNQVIPELRFEDLLCAPAELIGRGKHGSTYGVTIGEGVRLAVKRIKDWEISRDEFEKRMQRIEQVKHANVLPIVAYYCSKREKLLVYEYQQNGNLFSLLHESRNGQFFDWGSRLSAAASIAEALAVLHERLADHEGIAHGNLKSSNILLNKDMEPCISEYGLMEAADNSDLAINGISSSSFSAKADIYGYGVILLELLTGKLVQKSGFDLAKWVHSVVREEWTVEVFDKALIVEGASEERMVSLLQVALKCLDASPDARPSMRQVATVVDSIKQDEENSMSSDV